MSEYFDVEDKGTSIDHNEMLWDYKERDDGTIAITGYKGNENYVKVPKSINGKIVTNIASDTFDGCRNLESIEVDEDNPNYSSYDGVLYNKNKTQFECFPSHKYDFDIALGMKNGCDSEIPVDGNDIYKISYPESMTEVSKDFYKSYSLEDITIPETIWLEDGYRSPFNRCGGGNIPVIHGKPGTGAELQADDMRYTFEPFEDYEIEERKEAVKEWKRSISSVTADGRYYYIELTKGNIEITNYEPDDAEELLIPDTIEGKKVTSIGYSAFYGCDILKNITIPYGVTKIDIYAFEACTSLEKINIPSSVHIIEAGAFYNCEKLDNVVVPVGISKIEYGLFYNCVNLKNLILPDGISEIKKYAFEECNEIIIHSVRDGKLESLLKNYTDASIKFEPFTDSELAEYEKAVSVLKKEHDLLIWDFEELDDGTVKITNLKEKASIVKIPEFLGDKKVSAIGDFAFNYAPYSADVTDEENEIREGIKQVIIPEGITEIGEGAFMGSNIKSIVIPKGVTTIPLRAFDDCYELETVELPEGLEVIDDAAFYLCESLLNLNIPEGVVRIGAVAFECCAKIKNLSIPNSVIEICEDAFSSCKTLKNVPDSIKSMGIGYDGLFNNCSNLETVAIPDGMTKIFGFDGCEKLKEITIPESVTEITDGTFSDCKKLIIYGKSGSYAEQYAKENNILFYGNSETLTISDGITKVFGFTNCEKIKNVDIPDSVTEIEDAFIGCTNLESINIPDSVTEISNNSFSGCNKLVIHGNIGSKAESFAKNNNIVFDDISGLSDLESITIPDGVTEIAGYIGLKKLKDITIPESVTKICEGAFSGCDNLVIHGNIGSCSESFARDNNIAFDDISGLGDLENITIPNGITEIDGYANLKKIKNIIIPDSVTTIKAGAFNGCSSLESVTIPLSVTTIEIGAFKECDKVIITGITFSCAYNYAKDNNIAFNDINGFVPKEVENDEIALPSEPIILKKGTDGTAGTEGSYVLFGYFPQKIKADDICINTRRSYKINGWNCHEGNDGNYYVKEGDSYFKLESIKWRILDNNHEGSKLLLAENILENYCFTDYVPFEDIYGVSYDEHDGFKSDYYDSNSFNDYENSDIKGYINKNILNRAFSKLAQTYIKNIGLLSTDDLPDTECERIRKGTDYQNNNSDGTWWLSTSYRYDDFENYAYYIDSNGEEDTDDIKSYHGIVPTLLLSF